MWVTKRKVSEVTGLSAGQIKARIQRKKWRQGIEWAVIDGVQMIDLDAVEKRARAISESQQQRTTDGAKVIELK